MRNKLHGKGKRINIVTRQRGASTTPPRLRGLWPVDARHVLLNLLSTDRPHAGADENNKGGPSARSGGFSSTVGLRQLGKIREYAEILRAFES